MTCPSCAADPNAAPKRYCPARRCICGHADCYAFASWTPLARLNVTPLPKRDPSAWANREESTWIDKL